MRLIHKIPFSPQEIETYRQLIFDNITRGLKYIADAMEDMGLKVGEANFANLDLVDNAEDLHDGQPFPQELYQPLKSLWEDSNLQCAWSRGNEAALPEKYDPRFSLRAAPFPDINLQSWVLFPTFRPAFFARFPTQRTRYHPLPGTHDWYHRNNISSP